ncbi:MAG: polyhydroxyalkanoic acid system family protein [Alphaproteobacteria bacterium]|nr:polyhydroxyalkanoic acid system family protein [Alphaproteobacteria bacterium]
MPDVELEIANPLPMVAAVRKLDQVLAAAKQDQGGGLNGLGFDRQGNVFAVSGTVKGIGVSGRITVLDQLVKVNLSLPMAAYAYRGAAEKMIREYLEPRLI